MANCTLDRRLDYFSRDRIKKKLSAVQINFLPLLDPLEKRDFKLDRPRDLVILQRARNERVADVISGNGCIRDGL